MNLNPKALGLTAGILLGVMAFAVVSVSVLTGYLREVVIIVGSMHPWFSYTYIGALWMGALHFLCGSIAGWVFAKIYNKLAE